MHSSSYPCSAAEFLIVFGDAVIACDLMINKPFMMHLYACTYKSLQSCWRIASVYRCRDLVGLCNAR